MSHTPGPWEVDSDFDVQIGDGWAVLSDCAPDLQANAKLIAAAPDLLRLLQESVSTLADTRRPIEDWLNEARAVIRKATGVQP